MIPSNSALCHPNSHHHEVPDHDSDALVGHHPNISRRDDRGRSYATMHATTADVVGDLGVDVTLLSSLLLSLRAITLTDHNDNNDNDPRGLSSNGGRRRWLMGRRQQESKEDDATASDDDNDAGMDGGGEGMMDRTIKDQGGGGIRSERDDDDNNIDIGRHLSDVVFDNVSPLLHRIPNILLVA
jgi:hypothetical protein